MRDEKEKKIGGVVAALGGPWPFKSEVDFNHFVETDEGQHMVAARRVVRLAGHAPELAAADSKTRAALAALARFAGRVNLVEIAAARGRMPGERPAARDAWLAILGCAFGEDGVVAALGRRGAAMSAPVVVDREEKGYGESVAAQSAWLLGHIATLDAALRLAGAGQDLCGVAELERETKRVRQLIARPVVQPESTDPLDVALRAIELL